MDYYGIHRWRPYVPVAQRRRRAEAQAAKLRKSGRDVQPVRIAGRKIATTFWGEAWCHNLEAYSDYANRLPRGRTYVRNGSVFDLTIEAGRIRALVSGSDVYKVEIAIRPLARGRWTAIKQSCGTSIGSLVELLRGSLSRGVMEVVTRKGEGLFPSPREITLKCSCPDWAVMCKHVAAVLYGVGARLDSEPALLFALRGVDPTEMVVTAAAQAVDRRRPARGRVLADEQVASVFGIEIDGAATPRPSRRKPGVAKERERGAAPAGRRAQSVGRAVKPKPSTGPAGTREGAAGPATTREGAAKRSAARRPGKRAGAAKEAAVRQPTKKVAVKQTVKRRSVR